MFVKKKKKSFHKEACLRKAFFKTVDISIQSLCSNSQSLLFWSQSSVPAAWISFQICLMTFKNMFLAKSCELLVSTFAFWFLLFSSLLYSWPLIKQGPRLSSSVKMCLSSRGLLGICVCPGRSAFPYWIHSLSLLNTSLYPTHSGMIFGWYRCVHSQGV